MYCHVNVKTGTRAAGQSAAAKYDYISRDGRYARACQDEVVHVESGSMPAFASSDARLYWAAADSHERSNGRLFRSLTAALPNSLDFAGRLDLARSFAAHVTGGELPYTLALHAGLSKEGAASNPHLHLVFSERVNDGVERAAEQWFLGRDRVGRDASRPASRRAIGRGRRGPLPRGDIERPLDVDRRPCARPGRVPVLERREQRRVAARRREQLPHATDAPLQCFGRPSRRNSSSRMRRARRGDERASASSISPIPAGRPGV